MIHNLSATYATYGDAKLGRQIDRIFSKPAVTPKEEYVKITHWKGHVFCFVDFFHTLVREPYRFLKNALLTAELFFSTIRIIPEGIFGEHPIDLADICKANVSTALANVARPATYFTDLTKLFIGIFYPAAAIRFDAFYYPL